MTYTDDFNQKRDIILAIDMGIVKTPSMPLEEFHKGAEYLDMWCQNDKSKLEAAGMDWALVLDLPYRIGASRYAQANWDAKRFGRKEAQTRWVRESPEMYDTRNRVIHAMLYAYRRAA